MAKKKEAPAHFTMSGRWVACLHCGQRQDVLSEGGLGCTPKALKAWGLMIEDFQDRHRKCPCGPESPIQKLERDQYEWERGLFVGSSSATIFKALEGRWPKDSGGTVDVPHDPDDFSRCHRLLRVMPAWRSRMGEVAVKHPVWAPLVAAWDELTGLFEAKDYEALYDRMGTLRGARS